AIRGLIGPDTDAAALADLRQALGLNDPWPVQYARWMRGILFEGDFGRSISHNRPVTAVIGDNLMNTVRLSILMTVLLYLIAVPLGIIAGRRDGTLADKAILFYTFLAFSMPTIVLAVLLLFTFGFSLGWFPVMGSINIHASLAGGSAAFWSRLEHLILPAVTGALLGVVSVIYFLRNEIIDVKNSDFVTTARSKGVPENRVYSRHILRNALLPVAGGMGASIAAILVGSIFIEMIFSYPGMGQLFITSLTQRDWPVANTLIMFYAVVGVVGGLLADITTMIVDPRIRIK
ncbi:MAG: ABC transporter permease, partial [Treponema sp.]|nr:ABC transporter permease [Treponema sp.]